MSDASFRIMVVDDEPNICSGLAMALEEESYRVSTARNGAEAWDLFRRLPHQLVITDLKMPGSISGLDLVREIKHGWPEKLILVITAHGTIETAVEAMRLGAMDYLAKPVDLEMLGLQVRRAFEHHQLREEVRRLRARGIPFDAMDGQPVDIVFLTLAPPDEPEPYYEVMGRLVAIGRDEGRHLLLSRCRTAEQVSAFFAELDQPVVGRLDELARMSLSQRDPERTDPKRELAILGLAPADPSGRGSPERRWL